VRVAVCVGGWVRVVVCAGGWVRVAVRGGGWARVDVWVSVRGREIERVAFSSRGSREGGGRENWSEGVGDRDHQ
jgi:hypothetical protein